jgi:hypothetical protein
VPEKRLAENQIRLDQAWVDVSPSRRSVALYIAALKLD